MKAGNTSVYHPQTRTANPHGALTVPTLGVYPHPLPTVTLGMGFVLHPVLQWDKLRNTEVKGFCPHHPDDE